jgi:signal recognition particle subunit SRP54
MAERILGMGDVVSLVERAQEQFDEEEEARKKSKENAKNEFGFDDFLSQIQQEEKMGNMKDLVIPGASKRKTWRLKTMLSNILKLSFTP